MIHPRMIPYLLQPHPLPRTNPQTGLYEVLTLVGHLGYEVQLATADGLVTLKRNIAAHKIIQQDSKGPCSQLVSVIFSIHYPLWRGVYSGACNNCLVMYTYFDKILPSNSVYGSFLLNAPDPKSILWHSMVVSTTCSPCH